MGNIGEWDVEDGIFLYFGIQFSFVGVVVGREGERREREERDR
jgi:hypothetical protein